MSNPFSTGEEMANFLSDFVNHAGDKEKQSFVEVFTKRTHRTLQQGGMDLFLRTCEEWANMYEDGAFDLRNEYTCREAKIIKDSLDCMRMPLI